MRIVSAQELENWLAGGEILERDSHGVKVVKMGDGRILKIFRNRRSPALARLLRPEAIRFQDNAMKLQARAIATPQILECCWLSRSARTSACIYTPLAGTPLDKLFFDSRTEFDHILADLADYILNLHQQGIYFRSLHLGNILRTPHNSFGLIDFLDIRFKKRPLGKHLVRRNFAHLKNYLSRRNVQNFPWEALLDHYKNSSLNSSKALSHRK